MIKACKNALKGYDVALFRHPERDNIDDEAQVSLTMLKYVGLPLLEQVENYRTRGLPNDAGLWAGGVIVRQHGPNRVCFEDDWWHENVTWSFQDQLSLPYVLWKHNVHPGVISGSVYKTAFHTWHPTADPAKVSAPVVVNPKFSLITRTTTRSSSATAGLRFARRPTRTSSGSSR